MKIGAYLVDGQVEVKPTAYLDQSFQVYLEAIRRAGGRFVPEKKLHRFMTIALPRLATELAAAGFTLHLDDLLCHELSATADRLRDIAERCHQRIMRFEIEAFKELRPYQRVGALFLASHRQAGLFDSPGLGKTVQAALALPDDPIPPVIVVCPAVAKGVWEREFKAWRPDYVDPVILEGKRSFRWPRGGEIVILNYDILPAEPPAVGLEPGTVLIADEAHNLRNRRTARSTRFAALGAAVRAKEGKTWLLTGTPLQNRPPELWDVLSAADLAIPTFGSWARFRELFGGYDGVHGMEWDNTPEVSAVDALKQTTLRRSREDVLKELPPATYDVIKVDLDTVASEADLKFEAALKELGLTVKEALHRARASDGSRVFSQLSRLRELFAVAKIPTMLRVIEEHEAQDTPLVVFSAHRAPIEALRKREGWRVILGGTPASERTEIENAFQAGELKGVAGTIGAMATAITLTYGCHELFVDRDWVPTNNDQAEDRLRRIGQRSSVTITDLVANSKTDKMLYSVLAQKKILVAATIHASARDETDLPTDLAAGLEDLLQSK